MLCFHIFFYCAGVFISSLVFLLIQLIDDVLDFVSCEEVMGKPAATDLKLGLATAPVLFAAHKVQQAPCSQ